jgi:hypothetical protein
VPLFRRLLTPPSARTAATLLTILATSVTLGACTSSQSSSGSAKQLSGEEGRAQDVVEKFTEYADDDKAAAICRELLTPAAAKAVSQGSDCATAVQALIDATDYTALDVESVKITGTTAVATIVKTKRATNETKIVLVQAAPKDPWKIAGFGTAAAAAAPTGVEGSTPESTTPVGTTPKATPNR